MKKVRFLLAITAFVLIATSVFGCYMISGQPMNKLKGTYELKSYSWTNGKNNATTNYMVSIEYAAYLVVTGTSEGYYVWKSTDTSPTKIPVSLTYEYSQEDSSKVEYVYYTREGYEPKKFGVNKKNLNFNKPVVKFSETVYTNGEEMSFLKVSNATDLSYVIAEWGELADPVPVE